jgi:hypothetical protein
MNINKLRVEISGNEARIKQILVVVATLSVETDITQRDGETRERDDVVSRIIELERPIATLEME